MASVYRCHCGQFAYGEGGSCHGENRVVVESYVDADSSEGRDRARVRELALGLMASLGADDARPGNLETVMGWIRGVESDAEERGAREAIEDYEPDGESSRECGG